MTASPFDKLSRQVHAFAVERDWEKFHTPKNLAMAIAVEASELMEQFLWSEEQSWDLAADKKKDAVAQEMADVLIYLIRMSQVAGIDLVQAAESKLAINAEKYPAEKVRGQSKKYTEY